MKKGSIKIKDRHKRFLSKIENNTSNGCWEWLDSIDKKSGYGAIRDEFGVRVGAHVYSYKKYIGNYDKVNKRGEIMHICHKCDNPKCVNPFHLFLGTVTENRRDSQNKNRSSVAKHGSYRMFVKGCRCVECCEYVSNGRANNYLKIKQQPGFIEDKKNKSKKSYYKNRFAILERRRAKKALLPVDRY